MRPGPTARPRGLAVLAALLAAVACTPEAPAADPDPATAALIMVNQLRGENGLTPLTLDRRLGEAALRHARAMADEDFFGHVGPGGSRMGERLTQAGYVWSLVAENIAGGVKTAQEAVRTWTDSPGHLRNLLLEDAQHIGLAHVRREHDPGEVVFHDYWVLMLAAPGAR